MPPQRQLVRNRLLSRLAQEDFDVLAEHLHPVDMPPRFQLAQMDALALALDTRSKPTA